MRKFAKLKPPAKSIDPSKRFRFMQPSSTLEQLWLLATLSQVTALSSQLSRSVILALLQRPLSFDDPDFIFRSQMGRLPGAEIIEHGISFVAWLASGLDL